MKSDAEGMGSSTNRLQKEEKAPAWQTAGLTWKAGNTGEAKLLPADRGLPEAKETTDNYCALIPLKICSSPDITQLSFYSTFLLISIFSQTFPKRHIFPHLQ